MILDIDAEQDYWGRPEIVQEKSWYGPCDSGVKELLLGYKQLPEQIAWKPTVG